MTGFLRDVQIVRRMPLMRDIAHQQRAVERDASSRKQGFIGKIARMHKIDRERLHPPGARAQHDTVQPAAAGRCRVTQRAGLEEGGRVAHAAKHRGRRQLLRGVTDDVNLDATVRPVHVQFDAISLIGHLKSRSVMLAGKDPAACQVIDQRARVPPWNIDALLIIPNNGHPVGRVFAGEAEHLRHAFRPDVFQPDEADARDRVPVVELRPERCRQMPLHHVRLDPEVDEEPPAYDPVDLWKSHGSVLSY